MSAGPRDHCTSSPYSLSRTPSILAPSVGIYPQNVFDYSDPDSFFIVQEDRSADDLFLKLQYFLFQNQLKGTPPSITLISGWWEHYRLLAPTAVHLLSYVHTSHLAEFSPTLSAPPRECRLCPVTSSLTISPCYCSWSKY